MLFEQLELIHSLILFLGVDQGHLGNNENYGKFGEKKYSGVFQSFILVFFYQRSLYFVGYAFENENI